MKPFYLTKLFTLVFTTLILSACGGGGGSSSDSSGNAYLNTATLHEALNDTGITGSGNYPSGNNPDCTMGETFEQQDCYHGRDALATAGNLTKVGGGMAGFDFTKLDANGASLAASATSWACVKDNHTGLIWEVKTDDAQGDNLHSMNDRFNWYNTNATTNGGGVGSADDDHDICTDYDHDDGSTHCNTRDFVARVNVAGLCGATDWRLPNLNELQSIVYLGKIYPAIDENYFPNSGSGSFILSPDGFIFYWSSSPFADDSNDAWGVYFGLGIDDIGNRSRSNRVRLVRVGQ